MSNGLPNTETTLAAAVEELAAIDTSYLIISDRTSEVIECFTDYKLAVKAALKFRRAGAEVSLFKELKS